MRLLPTVLALVLLVAALPMAAPAAGAESCENVDVRVEEDSCGTVASLSVRGNASGTSCGDLDTCLTASGTGDASNDGWDGSCGDALLFEAEPVRAGCVAISGTGDASNDAGSGSCGASAGTAAVGVGCVAISGTGDASNEAGWQSCGLAGGTAVVAVGCVAISGDGNASNSAGHQSCGFGSGEAAVGVGCVAISGTGQALNTGSTQTCGVGFGTASAGFGCVAVSGTGEADNRAFLGSCGNANDLAVAGGCEEVEGDDYTGSASEEGPQVCLETAIDCPDISTLVEEDLAANGGS